MINSCFLKVYEIDYTKNIYSSYTGLKQLLSSGSGWLLDYGYPIRARLAVEVSDNGCSFEMNWAWVGDVGTW